MDRDFLSEQSYEKMLREAEAAKEFRDIIERDEVPSGVIFRQCSSLHYQVIVGKWIYNLYPTKKRVYADRVRRGPFIRIKEDKGFFRDFLDGLRRVLEKENVE